MKFKKIISAALAGALALSMSATAFATSITDLSEGAELELTSVTKGATISVEVPTSLAIGLNPYKLNVKLDDKGGIADDTTAGAQILSPVYQIVNKSTLDLNVTIEATGTANGEGMALVPAKPTTSATDAEKAAKWAVVQMQYAVGAPAAANAQPTMPGSPKKLVLDGANKVTAGGGTGSSAITLTKSATPATSALLFNFAGELNDKSTVAWNADDTIGATIAFHFSIKN